MTQRTLSAILFCAGVLVGWMLHPDAAPCEDADEIENDNEQDKPDVDTLKSGIGKSMINFQERSRQASERSAHIQARCKEEIATLYELQPQRARLGGIN